MLDLKLARKGRITIKPDGTIYCEGFDAKGASCRQVAALAMLWGIGVLQEELAAVVAKPGGNGKCAVD